MSAPIATDDRANWQPLPHNNWAWRNAAGYRIAAARVAPRKLRYSAFAPPAMPEAKYWEWEAEACTVVTRPPGDPTPQRIAYIGSSDTPEGARQIVEQYQAQIET